MAAPLSSGGQARTRARRARRVAAVAVVLVAASALACRSSSAPDRDTAVNDVLSQGQGKFTRQQAECYVDRVTQDLGAALLVPGARPTPAQLDRLTTIRIDCAGVASLGLPPDTRAILRAETQRDRNEPTRHGDSVQLDALWDACAQGSGEACDLLFDAAPVGSEYEEFASTCGGRTKELRCADRYAGRAASGTTLLPKP